MSGGIWWAARRHPDQRNRHDLHRHFWKQKKIMKIEICKAVCDGRNPFPKKKGISANNLTTSVAVKNEFVVTRESAYIKDSSFHRDGLEITK